MTRLHHLCLAGVASAALAGSLMPDLSSAAEPDRFEGRHFAGGGDVNYLRLLDTACGMFQPNAKLQHLGMLYMPAWNGLVEGPTWDAWWIQNSYGTTLAALPFLQEPFVTFLQNSQDLWFDQMGDGKRVGASPPFNWVAPDGALCDAARPGWIVYKQGDGRVNLHDWGMEFTAAGLLMQAEFLLITRSTQAIDHYLPKLERCARLIESRRDSANNLFLAGPAGNLLAPSYAGWKKPDGSYGMAYLAGLSVTYIAALDRLIELEKLAGRNTQAGIYEGLRQSAREGLNRLATEEGYFIRSLDPNGVRHGVFGAAEHGYFEASPNHDAVALRVVDDAQSARIMAKMDSIPGLRPHQFVIPNYPSYDDMYERPEGLWGFGTWVNGGHWSTCEARMVLAYYRTARQEQAYRSMRQLLSFAERFRMDNPLVKFGSDVYQPGQPINLTYDAFGPPAAFIRGLFEYVYRAQGLTLIPHVPSGIGMIEQRFPIRFGKAQVFVALAGQGSITSVKVNGQAHKQFDRVSVFLPAQERGGRLDVAIACGGVEAPSFSSPPTSAIPSVPPAGDPFWDCGRLLGDPLDNGLPLCVGADPLGGNRFIGQIKGVRIWRRALKQSEVAQQARDGTMDKADDSLLLAFHPARLRGGSLPSSIGSNMVASVKGESMADGHENDSALEFSGRGYLELQTRPALAIPAGYSLEAWIRPGAVPASGGRVIDHCTPGTSDGYMVDYGYQGQIRFICEYGVVQAKAKVDTNAWQHIVATLDTNRELRLYLDGAEIARQQGKALQASSLDGDYSAAGRFYLRMRDAGLGERQEAQHAWLLVECVATAQERIRLKSSGQLRLLPARSQRAADRSYLETNERLWEGLQRLMKAYGSSQDEGRKRIAGIWKQSVSETARLH